MNATPTNALEKYMAPENAIAIDAKGQLEIANTAQACMFAMMMSESKMLPPNTTPQQAAIAIIAGKGIGMNPFSAVQNIAVINNRPSIWGDALVALALSTGEVEDMKTEWIANKEGKRVACRYLVKRKHIASPFVGEFSLKMAQEAGLLNRQPWKLYTQRMLENRARAFAIRNAFADVLMGVSVREEQEDIAYAEKNKPVTPTAVPKANADALADALAGGTTTAALPEADVEVDVPEPIDIPQEAEKEKVMAKRESEELDLDVRAPYQDPNE